MSEITRGLKLLAMEENVAIVLLSQLSRDNVREKRAPILSDLRESGSIEENADQVFFVWIRLVWLGNMTKFENEDFREGGAAA